jgi:hypothetical protein
MNVCLKRNLKAVLIFNVRVLFAYIVEVADIMNVKEGTI